MEKITQFPFELTDEDRHNEFARAQASCAYCELNIIYRAEQTIKQILGQYGDNEHFNAYAEQMGIDKHLDQYR